MRVSRLAAKLVIAVMIGLVWPTLVAVAKPRVAVVSQDAGLVTTIDPLQNKVATSADVGKGPAAIAAAVDGRTLYLTYPDQGTVGLFDSQGSRLIRMIAVGGEPFGIVAGDDALFVSDWTRNVVSRIDLKSGRITDTIPVGRSPAGLALDIPRRRLYVADRDDGAITVIDITTTRNLGVVPTGSAPFALALAPDGKRLYVANVRSNDLAVIDTIQMRRIDTIAVGSSPYGVAVTPDGTTVLVTNQHSGTISVIDAERFAVAATIAVGHYPEGVVAISNSQAYVVNWFSGSVSAVDLVDRREINRIEVGDGPRTLVLFTVRE